MDTAQHLPGVQNVDADWASRHFSERTEWTLNKEIFTRMVAKYYTPQVDLFPSRLNHQLPRYVSRHPDPGAMEVDAMTLQWDRWTSFIHAPIVMLHRILKKIARIRQLAFSLLQIGQASRGIRFCWRC